MNQPASHEPFLDWDLGGLDDAEAAPRKTLIWSLESAPFRLDPGPGAAGPEPAEPVPELPRPAPVESADPVADFTLHPEMLDDSDPPPACCAAADIPTLTPSELAGDQPRPDPTVVGGRTVDPGRGKPAPADSIPFPRRGDGIGGFRLIGELGRGAFGRVYLAEEAGLGNRAVALKVSRPEGDEPRILARLQHTHIVPIHSVHDDPATGLRLMCMPYFGGANLAQVLEAAGTATAEAGPSSRGVARSLIEALDFVGHPAVTEASLAVGAAPPPPSSTASASGEGRTGLPGSMTAIDPDNDPAQPARRFLRHASSIRAAVWIAARLAEGLEHAHSRGLLHRDLKPSNILIAADGTPMLLDFNLATDAVGPDGASKAMLGGTLPYMAPEHLDAFNPKGTTRPGAVNERSDLYGLGLILFEMIAGRPPFPGVPPGMKLIDAVAVMTEQRSREAPSLRAANPDVPWSLDAIVRRCLEPDPDRRYARAGDLAEDLRRFLDDQPLRFAAEPSLRERAVKWARRNPKLLGATPVALLALVLLGVLGGAAWSLARNLDQVSTRLGFRVFQGQFQECQIRLMTTSGMAGTLDQGIRLAERAIAQAGIEDRGKGRGRSWIDVLDEDERREARRDLTELILLVSRARVAQAAAARNDGVLHAVLEKAVNRLDAAERRDPDPPLALYADRHRYLLALGRADRAARDLKRCDEVPPRTGRDFYMLGTGLLADGKPHLAAEKLDRAIMLDPRRFWSWFALGLCHFEQERFSAAAGDFGTCGALAPQFHEPWLNRGLAFARDGRLDEARVAYGKALEINPNAADALFNRGLAHLELGDPAAIADFRKAMDLGRTDPDVKSGLAEALAHAGRFDEALPLFEDAIRARPGSLELRAIRATALINARPDRAEEEFRHVLGSKPDQPLALLGMARLRKRTDPAGALADADRAIRAGHKGLGAVELRAWLRGRLGMATAADDVSRLEGSTNPNHLYNAACALALLARTDPDPGLKDRAVALLRRAVDLRFPPAQLRTDPDLESLRRCPAFLSLAGP